MAKETLLKKQFRERDVQRIRNLVTKKFDDTTSVQVGYQTSSEDHKEGDIWEEDDRTWIMKDGIKQTHTKLDGIKNLLRVPLTCPKCKRTMKTGLDKKMFRLHSTCFECVVEFESELKRTGKYDEYVRNTVSANMITHIEEAEQFIEDFANTSNQTYVTEQGDVEDWEGGKNNILTDQWKKELTEMKETLKK